MIKYLLDLLFGCQHTRYSWPITTKAGTHVACLECGKALAYDFAGLGGKPAHVPAPRTTAPRRFELAVPGRYHMQTGTGVCALDLESRDSRGLVTSILLP